MHLLHLDLRSSSMQPSLPVWSWGPSLNPLRPLWPSTGDTSELALLLDTMWYKQPLMEPADGDLWRHRRFTGVPSSSELEKSIDLFLD